MSTISSGFFLSLPPVSAGALAGGASPPGINVPSTGNPLKLKTRKPVNELLYLTEGTFA